MGSIPAKLDSVKYIGNRFKGGLALKTAQYFASKPEFDVTAVKWKYSDIGKDLSYPRGTSPFDGMTVVDIDDINEYYGYVCYPDETNLFDVYVLAGAVANLMPMEPFKGKFPSHNYKEGDRIDIPFTIAPRIIDQVKKVNPRATLVGYKLFDGNEEELISAGRETLRGSKANVVFANTPTTAKTKKLALTQDGSVIPLSFDEHVLFMESLIQEKWFRSVSVSEVCDSCYLTEEQSYIVTNFPRTRYADMPGSSFGTFAVKDTEGFWTTRRGKGLNETDYVRVFSVSFEERVVKYEGKKKPTLNTPFLAKIFQVYPDARFILHNHKTLPDLPMVPYKFPGTLGEVEAVEQTFDKSLRGFNIQHHGYVVWFDRFESVMRFIESGETDING
jgi:hypothetical protein